MVANMAAAQTIFVKVGISCKRVHTVERTSWASQKVLEDGTLGKKIIIQALHS